MSVVHVGYDSERGWRLIDPVAYGAPFATGYGYCIRRAALNEGDQLRLRVTFDRPQPEAALYRLAWRAERWLIDAGYARKQRGGLIVDREAVDAALRRALAASKTEHLKAEHERMLIA